MNENSVTVLKSYADLETERNELVKQLVSFVGGMAEHLEGTRLVEDHGNDLFAWMQSIANLYGVRWQQTQDRIDVMEKRWQRIVEACSVEDDTKAAWRVWECVESLIEEESNLEPRVGERLNLDTED